MNETGKHVLKERIARAASIEVRAATCSLVIGAMVVILIATLFSLSMRDSKHCLCRDTIACESSSVRSDLPVQCQMLRGILLF